MSQQTRLGTHATNVRQEDGDTVVRYHETDVLRFNATRIELNTGGWFSATTKTRLNQASFQFSLGYSVHQKRGLWYVTTGKSILTWPRNANVIHFGR